MKAAARAFQPGIFPLALLGSLQAAFEFIEQLAIFFRKVNIFSRPFQQPDEIAEAVLFFVHEASLL